MSPIKEVKGQNIPGPRNNCLERFGEEISINRPQKKDPMIGHALAHRGVFFLVFLHSIYHDNCYSFMDTMGLLDNSMVRLETLSLVIKGACVMIGMYIVA